MIKASEFTLAMSALNNATVEARRGFKNFMPHARELTKVLMPHAREIARAAGQTARATPIEAIIDRRER